VPNWSGLNPFSATIDGLPTGAPIFFRAYAKNISGTGYSDPVSSFSTLSQPTVQASNIAFPNASAKAIRITWTRGNGDGSIVVMRVGVPADPGIQAPADGDDYAFSTDYTLAPELPVNSQNYVVYKGPDSNIVVRGLTASTNYSVAIYEYGRLGANPDYLLTTPAEGSHATTDVPVHNMDNGVECDDCHSHGEWNPTRVGLITACQVCHNSSAPEAPNKLMFENHLTPSKNPSIDVVACGACHELHNPNINDTTLSFNVVTGATELNKSFLRANVDKYVSTASPPAYLHTDQPLREAGNPNSDPEALADTPDRAVEGGGEVTGTPDNTQATGYCQVCHTLTKYNRSTNLLGLVGDEGVSDQCHDGESGNCGPAETNCGECHQHKDGFQGIGGSQTCIECHSSPAPPLPRPIITTQFDRFTSHITGGSAVVAQPDCMVCHDQAGHPGDQIVGMRDLDDPLGTTLYEQPNAGFPTISTGEGEAFAGHCLSCHDADGASVLSGDVDRTPSSPFIGSGAPKIIDSTAWSTAGHNRLSATFPTSPVTCLGDGNNGCHASGHGTESPALLANAAEPNPAEGAAVNPTVFCYNCHDADGPSSKDIEADFNTATNFRVVSGSKTSALINQRHDISDVADDTVYPFYTDGDQTYSGAAVSCKDCHSPHVDNASFPVADPDTALPLAP
ncbi:MAG: cytochrome c3 family protein, partial [Planctomycetota bacterium]